MKSKAIKDVFKMTCGVCGDVLKYRGSVGSQIVTVKHYEAKHPDRIAQCYDTAGQTWNSQYDACLKALHHTTTQRDAAIKERDAAAAQQRSLAAKLNAIVLILRND